MAASSKSALRQLSDVGNALFRASTLSTNLDFTKWKLPSIPKKDASSVDDEVKQHSFKGKRSSALRTVSGSGGRAERKRCVEEEWSKRGERKDDGYEGESQSWDI